MDIIYYLIPMAIVIVIGIVGGLFWAVKSGQFDDMEGPAHRIIMDEEEFAEDDKDKKAKDE
jgi:cbb3-type cytochrome oxidase maturation protein